jgi:protein-S-isoprenylcysteine O-methyltransferase Ste14
MVYHYAYWACWAVWLIFVFAFGSLWMKLRVEEGLMLDQFPGEYPEYRRRTKALIPYLL